MTTEAVRTAEAGTPRRRWYALAALATMQFVIVVDGSIVNVGLPTIQRELGFGAGTVGWVINGFLLAGGSLLLLGGRISDLFGRKRMVLAGSALFAIASVFCGLASSGPMLVIGRFGQGVGEALTLPAALSLVALLFPQPRERARALGAWGGVTGLAGITGGTLSGVITELLGWRWLFFSSVPVVAVAVLATAWLVSDNPAAATRRRLDLPGAALLTGGLLSLVYALLAAARQPWGSLAVLLPLLAGLAGLVAFVLVETHRSEPLVPLGFFANRVRVSANLATVSLSGVMSLMFLLLTMYMQNVLGLSPMHSGLGLLPAGVVFTVSASLCGRAMGRLGWRRTLLLAFGSAAAGMLMLAGIAPGGAYSTDVLPGLLVVSVGLGGGLPALQAAALHQVSGSDAGLGSGIQISVQSLSKALGLAVLLPVAAGHTDGRLTGGVPRVVALTEGYQLAFGCATGILVVGGFVVLVLMKSAAGSSYA